MNTDRRNLIPRGLPASGSDSDSATPPPPALKPIQKPNKQPNIYQKRSEFSAPDNLLGLSIDTGKPDPAAASSDPNSTESRAEYMFIR
ncbi:unnamed protein product [Cuscuta campestris]|uniref:Uncharacterized protein n=1 Tax=Cuscuta campestris TaxID=132261 RepID=A0A484KNG7_9ASTE|nr:unnamed protein product [Cuscuta campestris]